MCRRLIAGAALWRARAWRRLSRWLLLGRRCGAVICGLSPLGDLLIQPLEDRFPRAGPEREGGSIAGIIVLGGAEDRPARDRGELAALNEAAERYTEAVALARRYPRRGWCSRAAPARCSRRVPPEAETARRVFEALGVERERLTLEAKSRNTHENAVFTARLLEAAGPASAGCS